MDLSLLRYLWLLLLRFTLLAESIGYVAPVAISLQFARVQERIAPDSLERVRSARSEP